MKFWALTDDDGISSCPLASSHRGQFGSHNGHAGSTRVIKYTSTKTARVLILISIRSSFKMELFPGSESLFET